MAGGKNCSTDCKNTKVPSSVATEPANGGHNHDHGHDDVPSHDHGSASMSGTQKSGSGLNGLLLHVPAMDCPAEEGQIRAALKDMSGVRSLQFDLAARTLAVDAPESLWAQVIEKIEKIGLEINKLETELSIQQAAKVQRTEMWRCVVALGVAVVAELVHLFAGDALPWAFTGMALAAIAIGLAGFSVLRKGWFAISHANLNINALMSVAVVGAFAIGDWPEAAMVMALYSIAELIEARAVSRARSAIKGLLNLAPSEASVMNTLGEWERVSAREVKQGAKVRVKPGERFAFDGKILEGHSSADQAAITGESVPVEKAPGDQVFAGTVNQYSELVFEVQSPANETVLARIIHVVEQAQSTRAPIQRFVDRFAAVYTPAVFVMALLVAIVSPLLFDMTWLDSVYKALVLLVIACPCALVISTPVTIVSGLTAAARQGILIKGGVYLELAHRIRWMALDKTGTLTQGQPQLVAQQLLSSIPDADHVLQIASSLASRSDHPVSVAIATGLATNVLPVERFSAEPGKGVVGWVQGTRYRLGNHRWIHALGLCSDDIETTLKGYEQQGYTLSVLAEEEAVLAVFAVADTVRQTSKEAVGQLQSMGIKVLMLTGDNALTARHIADEVGIDEVRAELLPEDKVSSIQELVSSGQLVGMVGDGINDSPALASADVGFAMGQAGTDIAMEAADVVVMNDDLRRIPDMIKLSKKVHQILWQNISLALGIKVVFLALAIFGHATMWMAVFADMGASLLVVFNGLRLIRNARSAQAKTEVSGSAQVSNPT